MAIKVNGVVVASSGMSQHSADLRYLKNTGGSLTGTLALGGNKITNLGTPTANTDAATKAYVDSTTASAVAGVTALSLSGSALYQSNSDVTADVKAAIGVPTLLSGTFTLPSTGWTNNTSTTGYYQITVTVSGVLSTDDDTASIFLNKSFSNADTDNQQQSSWNLLAGANVVNNGIVFYTETVPAVNIPVKYSIIRF